MEYIAIAFIEHVQEVMLYVKGADNIEPSHSLRDFKIIKEISNRCGMKTIPVSAPTKHDEVEKV